MRKSLRSTSLLAFYKPFNLRRPKANRLFGLGLRIWEIVVMKRFEFARLGAYNYYTITRCRTSHFATYNFDSLSALASTYMVRLKSGTKRVQSKCSLCREHSWRPSSYLYEKREICPLTEYLVLGKTLEIIDKSIRHFYLYTR